MMNSHDRLQNLLENKLSVDDKIPKNGRLLRNKIFVIGFPPNCTEKDLQDFFSNFGPVRETRIIKDEHGITKGFAFITFQKQTSVVHALQHRDPLYFMDRKLSINPAIKQTSTSLRNDWRTSSYSKNEHFINSAIYTNLKENQTFVNPSIIPFAYESNADFIDRNLLCQMITVPFIHLHTPLDSFHYVLPTIQPCFLLQNEKH